MVEIWARWSLETTVVNSHKKERRPSQPRMSKGAQLGRFPSHPRSCDCCIVIGSYTHMIKFNRDGQMWVGYPHKTIFLSPGLLDDPDELYGTQSHTTCWFCERKFVGYPRWTDGYGRRVCSHLCEHLSNIYFFQKDLTNDPNLIQNDPTKICVSNYVNVKDRKIGTRPNGSLAKRPMNDSRVTGSNPGCTTRSRYQYNKTKR